MTRIAAPISPITLRYNVNTNIASRSSAPKIPGKSKIRLAPTWQENVLRDGVPKLKIAVKR
jgi:hypothetical protein